MAAAKAEFGDFQTPGPLAARVCSLLNVHGAEPASIVEPTCGKGAFLLAATEAFRPAAALGWDINRGYVQQLRRHVPAGVVVKQGNFFALDWPALFKTLREPILVVGNPPWVTNSTLGAMGGGNLPGKSNSQRRRGIEALTGDSNFDISEWMLLRLLESLNGRAATLAMLCKTAVARKVLQQAWRQELAIAQSAVYAIDAQREFGAAVDACLLLVRLEKAARGDCDLYDSLESPLPSSSFGVRGGRLVADLAAYERSRSYLGDTDYRWRSGIKHDCARVMELIEDGGLYNGIGESVDIEPEILFPMLKSSALANGRTQRPRRWMIVTQSRVGEETSSWRARAPRAWRYLCRHGSLLDSRRSRIYRGKPRFSMFGVGPYTFAPWKVAISSLYKRGDFSVVGKYRGKPVVLDDTCYAVECKTRGEAQDIESALNSEVGQDLLSALTFWDAKRPITSKLLQQIRLEQLVESHAARAAS